MAAKKKSRVPTKAPVSTAQKTEAKRNTQPQKRNTSSPRWKKVDKNIEVYHGVKGDRFRAILRANGNRSFSPTVGTQAEAHSLLKKFEAEKALCMVPSGMSSITLDAYISQYIGLSDLAGTTRETYLSYQQEFLRQGLGRKKLSAVKPDDIRAFMKYQQNNSKQSNATINKRLTFLIGVYNRAVKNDVVRTNPAKNVEKLTVYKNDSTKQFTEAEQRERFEAVKDDVVACLAFLLGDMCGLRRGEMAGLEWHNVNLETGSLYVCNERTKFRSQIYEKPPKSAKGIRTVPLSPLIVSAFKCYKKVQDENKSRYGKAYYVERDFVFVDEKGNPLRPEVPHRKYRELLLQAGIEGTKLHDLRHTASGNMISSGAAIHDVSRVLGHADVATTMRIYLDGNKDSIKAMTKAQEHMEMIFANKQVNEDE